MYTEKKVKDVYKDNIEGKVKKIIDGCCNLNVR